VKSAFELLETEGRQQVVGESSRTSELKGLWFSQKKKRFERVVEEGLET
jgi:hypothetical protein